MEACSITGPAGSGKTQHLVDEVVSRLAEGAGPREILILSATPLSRQQMHERLEERAEQEDKSTAQSISQVRVLTPRDFALDILADEEAIAWSGRKPRLLTPFEEDFLMEDMKVSGLRQRRLREMLKFFYRSWSDLADDDPDWLISEEEIGVHGLLKDSLKSMQAIVEPELSNLAVGYLRAYPKACKRHAFAHVFVDDYLCMSRASQVLADLIATKSLSVAGDHYAHVAAFESYPYAGGFDDFAKKYPKAKKVCLDETLNCPPCTTAAQALTEQIDDAEEKEAAEPTAFIGTKKVEDEVAQIPPCAEADAPRVVASHTFEDEYSHVADIVEESLGETNSSGDAGRVPVIVATPNNLWAQKIAESLEGKGIAAERFVPESSLRCDISRLESSLPARLFTLLGLMADEHDSMAWRAYIGFGDYLAYSNQVAQLRAAAKSVGLDFAAALERLADEAADAAPEPASPGEEPSIESLADKAYMQPVLETYRQGQDIIKTLSALTGAKLLDALTELLSNGSVTSAPASVLSLYADADGNLSDSDDAATLLNRARTRLVTSAVDYDCAAPVLILNYDQMLGTTADTVIVSGFVNGFMPCRDYFDLSAMTLDQKDHTHLLDSRRAYVLLTKAHKHLVISYFDTAALEDVDKLQLHFSRMGVIDGKRICTIEPSELLAYAFGPITTRDRSV